MVELCNLKEGVENMMIEKTGYTIVTAGATLRVVKNGRVEAQGFGDKESALKAIHVIEGSEKKDFYTESKSLVYKNTKLEVELC